ncbi:hypothetical protein LTR97_011339 [Elasticomyces elasticus]|uniref:Major facilitator superfamily (MFS) profile domain-containing protein n=1 Tax=Elasticomyces elasticus TaxID=574655 RepID=A0AAN7W2U3_9PEZI|nr:hypothetical protein LTR97_011339 [Elasticomyces elasticus]
MATEQRKVDKAGTSSSIRSDVLQSPKASGIGEVVDLDGYDQQYIPDEAREKKLLWKVDLIMIPMLWWMCVLAYVDRNNIGNANAAGMSRDLGLDDLGYSMLINIFFIAYLFGEIPSNLILARARPSLYLPGLACIWGTLVCGMSQVDSYGGILAYRFFLGLEAGFMPGVLYIMTCWYKRSEIGKRFSIFFTALCFSGAVSGLLSGAVISGLEGVHGMAGWRWLFLIEGLLTVATAIGAIFVLPNYPATTKWLKPDERVLLAGRVLADRQGDSAHPPRKFSALESVKAAFSDLRTYFFMVLYMLDNGSAILNYFIPTVLQQMGYKGVHAQWMTIPVWVVATVFLLVVSQSSDRSGDRRWHLTAGLGFAFTSGLVVAFAENVGARYAFICFFVGSVYSTLPLILTWLTELISTPSEKRGVAIAAANAVGNLSALYGSQLWPASAGPDYIAGFTAVACFSGVGAILSAALPIIFTYLPKYPTKAEKEFIAEQSVRREDMEQE